MPEKKTIRGYITASDWNDENEVNTITISTDDDEDIPICLDEGMGQELLEEHEDEEIEATGYMSDSEFVVESYEVC